MNKQPFANQTHGHGHPHPAAAAHTFRLDAVRRACLIVTVALSLSTLCRMAQAQTNEPGPVVRPYSYGSTLLRDLGTPDPLSLLSEPDGMFDWHFMHDVSVWNRYTNSSRTITYTNWEMNDLSYYLELYNGGSYDPRFQLYLEEAPWHLSGGITTNQPPVPPNDEPPWYHLDYTWQDLGNNRTTTDTQIELLTLGSTNTALLRPYILSVTAWDFPTILEDQGPLWENSVPLPDQAIRLLSKQPSNGIIVTNLADDLVLDVTPELLTYTNCAFSVGAQRVKVAITMATSGPITPLVTNVVNGVTNITGPDHYIRLTNWWENGRTNLGAGGPTHSPGLHFGNLTEFSAQVPNHPDFQSGWVWRRDIHGARWLWDPVTNIVKQLSSMTSTPNAPPANGNDDPATAGGDYWDTSPDANLTIFDHDAPSIRSATFTNTVIGTVIALRFNARQWLTWNGALASDVINWSGSVTIKRVGLGTYDWVRVDLNPNAAGHMSEQDLDFTAEEASNY